MKRIEKDIKCQKCEGTGVCVGSCEIDGAAVVCPICKGTGRQHYVFEYEEFEGIERRDDVTRVYKQNYGFVISPNDVYGPEMTKSKSDTIDMLDEGVDYEDFLNGKMPTHIEKLACPMVLDELICYDIPGFVDECRRLHGDYIISIYNCSYQQNNDKCWERFKEAQKDNDQFFAHVIQWRE